MSAYRTFAPHEARNAEDSARPLDAAGVTMICDESKAADRT